MTSNLGSDIILEGIGADGEINEASRKMVEQLLKQSFRPEFLNRLDETIMFKPLTKDNIGGIINLIIKDINRRLADKELHIEVSEQAKKYIVDNGYDPVYGARPLKRYIQKYVETLAARQILSGNVSQGDTIMIVLDENTNELSALVVETDTNNS